MLFGDLLSHSYNITFSMFLYLVLLTVSIAVDCDSVIDSFQLTVDCNYIDS